MINIGVIGCGQWGPNHVRNFSHLTGSRTLMCADFDVKRLKVMKETFRNIHPTTDSREIIRHPKIDAVVIATPTRTHFSLVKQCLEAGKDVLCEKPLCTSAAEAERLIELAAKKKRILMVGHVFIFNMGIRHIRDLVKKNRLGKLYYMNSDRTNLGPIRTDVSAVWDLAPHDISIFNFLLDQMPSEVSAVGGRYLQKKLDDVAFISLRYPKGIMVNIHVSWLDPKKVRRITVVGSKKMLLWDDLDNEGPLRIYNRQVVPAYYETFGDYALLSKEGDITIPKISLEEPLKAQGRHFLDCLVSRKKPLCDGTAGLQTVKVLEAIEKSLHQKGMSVAV